MVSFEKPDWKCVFTYVQTFFQQFYNVSNPPVRTKKLNLTPVSHLLPTTNIWLEVGASFRCEKGVGVRFFLGTGGLRPLRNFRKNV